MPSKLQRLLLLPLIMPETQMLEQLEEMMLEPQVETTLEQQVETTLEPQVETTLEPLADGRCRYRTEDAIKGLLTPIVMFFYRKAMQRGFDGVCTGLKARAESLALPHSTE